MNNFKTLAEARGAYDALLAELTEAKQKIAQIADLEAQLAESKAFGSTTATENENFRLLLVQKDGEISALKTDKETLSGQVGELKTELETLKKEQKTVKTAARELVAASGGVPLAVDQGEISRMQAGSQKEFRDMMLKETDQTRLNELYREYNRLFRPNGKEKKK